MTSKSFACAALVFLLAACSGEQQIGQDTECVEDGDCPAGFTCENGLCEGESSATADAGSGLTGDGGTKVRASGEVDGPSGVQVEVETEDCMRSPMCEVKPGRSVTFYAPEVDGYRFTGWTGGPLCKGSNPVLTISEVTEDTVCTAQYVRRVTVSGESDGLGAEVVATSAAAFAQCLGTTTCVVDEGSTVVLSASEVSGYRFAGFVGDNCSDVEGLSVFVQAGKEDVTCTASYVRSFEVGAASVGATTPIGVQSDTAFSVCGDGRCVIDEQGEVTLTAPTLAGYRFAGWSGDAVCVGSDLTLRIVPITDNVSCAANYVRRFTATGLAEGSSSNLVPLATSSADFADCNEGVCVVDEGSDVVLSARTIPGYRLTGFSGAGCDNVSGTAVALDDMSADRVCTAQYVEGISIAGNVVGATGSVIASSSSPGNSCAAGGCVVDAGGTVTLTAPALNGYRFTGWTGDAGCSGTAQNLTLRNVVVSATCNASFIKQWAIAGNASPSVGGSVTATAGLAACANASCTVDEGVAVTLSATPSSAAYRFESWTGSNALCTGTSASLVLQNVDVVCTARFVRRWAIAATIGPVAGGTVAATPTNQPACANAACEVDEDVQVTLTATASSSYRFVSWTGANPVCAGTSPTLALSNVNATCAATFIQRFRISAVVGAVQGGTVSATPAGQADCANASCEVDQGAQVTLSATPSSPAYRFLNWTGSDAACTGTTPAISLSNRNAVCTANFTQRWNIAAVVGAGGGGSVSATPTGQSACANASCSVDEGVSVTLTATASSPAYRFANWTGAQAACSGTSASLQLANVNAVCTANFVPRWTVSFPDPAAGSIAASNLPASSTCTATSCVLDSGSSLRLVATADNPGTHRFSNWSGCSSSTNAQLDLTNISASVTCTANFVQRFTMAATAGTGGTVSATPSGQSACANASCTVDQAVQVTLTATPSTGYRFVSWTGTNAACTGTTTSIVLSNTNATCTASFAQRFTIAATVGPVAGGTVLATPSGQPACANASCSVDQDTQVTLSATPSSLDYRFVSWTGNHPSCAGTAALALSNVSATCVANFVRRWTIAAVSGNASAGGVSATPNGQPACTNASCTVDQATSVTLSAAPASSAYRFASWTGANAQCTGTNATLQLANTNATCTANFVARFSVAFPDPSAGSVAASNFAASTVCTAQRCDVDVGTGLRLTATADNPSTHRFGSWSGCSTSTNPQLDLSNISANTTCTASFIGRWNIAAVATPTAGGQVTATPSGQAACANAACTVDQNVQVTLLASANAGYRFVGWSGADAACTGINASLALSNVNATCTATFSQRWNIGAVVATDGGGTVAATPSGQAACASAACEVDPGVQVTLSAAAASTHRFLNWSGASAACTGTTPSLTLSNTNATCTANFMRRWNISAVATPTVGGSVSATPSGQTACANATCTVDQNVEVSLLATPSSAAYRFVGWSGANPLCSGTGTSLTLQNTQAACSATFARRWTVSFPNPAVGLVTPSDFPGATVCSATACTADQASTLRLTAAPDNATTHRFLNWSGCSTSTNPVLDLTVTADSTCTANFAQRWTMAAVVGGSVPGAAVTATPEGQPACANASCTVDQNVAVTLSASFDNTAYRFVGWTGANAACTGSDPSLTLQNTNATCTATFVQRFSIGFPDPGVGSVSPSNFPGSTTCNATRCEVDRGTALRLTATATNPSSHRFARWSGCSTSTNAVLDLANITASATCTAVFSTRVVISGVSAPSGLTVVASSTAPSPQAVCSGNQCTVDAGTTPVRLTAAASTNDYVFQGWSGTGCSDSDNDPLVLNLASISQTINCVANYRVRVTVALAGNTGGVSISSPGAGITCNPAGGPFLTCWVNPSAAVTINAIESGGARFNAWTGGAGCAGAASHSLNVNTPTTCTASFARRWNVSFADPAAGSITASNFPANSVCGPTGCAVDDSASLRLTAAPDNASTHRFLNWSGCSTSTSPVLDLTITADTTCTANFVQRWTVGAVIGPVAGGNVSATADGQPTCSGASCTVDQDVQVTLLATASSPAYRFVNWSGTNAACTGINASLVLQNTNATCTANFTQRWTIAAVVGTVTGGSVSATPSSLPACTGASCTVDQNVLVTLLATVSSPAYRFVNWTGANAACTGTNASLVLQNTNATCTANFRARVTVSFPDPAVGSITPSNFSPSSTCTSTRCDIDGGTAIRLTAAPDDPDSDRFVSWSGCSTSTNPVLDLANITSNLTCNAVFVRRWYITFTGTPTGGTVTSVPGATCTGADVNDCRIIVDQGTNVDLTAVAATNYRFGSWTCADADTTTVNVLDLNNVSADLTCNARFVRRYRARGLVSGAPTGTSVTIAPCNNSDCTVDEDTNVTLTAPVVAGYTFNGWSGAGCSDSNPDNNPRTLQFTPIQGDVTCTASYGVLQRFTISVSRNPSGIGEARVITPSSGNPVCTGIGGINTSCTVNAGTSVQLSGSSNGGAVFTGFTGPSTCSAGSLVAQSNIVCTANFYGLWSRSYATGYRSAAQFPYDGMPKVDALPRDDGRIAITDTVATHFTSGPTEYRGWFAPLDEHTGTAEGDSSYFVLDASGAPFQTFAFGLTAAPDGGTAMIGTRFLGNVHSPLLTVFDKEDRPVLSHDFRGTDASDYLTQIIWRQDRYYAVGHYESPLTAHVAAFTDSGKLLFNRSVAQPLACRGDYTPTRGQAIAATREGIAVLSRVERSFENRIIYSILLSILSPAGETLREVMITAPDDKGELDVLPRGIFVTRDDAILIVGSKREQADPTSAQNAFAMFLKPDLNPVWQFEIGAAGDDAFWDVIEGDSPEDFIIAGSTSALPERTSDGWLTRVRMNGDTPVVTASYAYGSRLSEMLTDVERVREGGYALAGYRYDPSLRIRTYSTWVTRVNDDLKIGFNAASGLTMEEVNLTPRAAAMRIESTSDKCYYNVFRQSSEAPYTPDGKDPNLSETSHAP